MFKHGPLIDGEWGEHAHPPVLTLAKELKPGAVGGLSIF
jgi:hypothetical protein